MNLCVFQGTFNPIHVAHLRVAEYVLSKYKFDKILFIPAYCPPHKDINPELASHRLNMAKIATKNYDKFEVSDIEYQNGGKSYTYLTIKELYKRYDIDEKINFIIGTDAFDKIKSWYEIDKLKQMVKFIVFLRDENFDEAKYNDLRTEGYDFVLETLPFMNISSTQLRNKIKTCDDIKDLVTKETEEYIKTNGLYKD